MYSSTSNIWLSLNYDFSSIKAITQLKKEEGEERKKDALYACMINIITLLSPPLIMNDKIQR